MRKILGVKNEIVFDFSNNFFGICSFNNFQPKNLIQKKFIILQAYLFFYLC